MAIRKTLSAACQDVSAETACEIPHKAFPRKRDGHGGQERGNQSDDPVRGMSGKSVGLRRWIVYGGRLANLGGQAFLPWPLG